MRFYPYACLYIDCTWRDWIRGVRFALKQSSDRIHTVGQIRQLFSKRNEAMLTISVRTALDLYLQAKNFPRGSEVLLSAINIPDVVKIIRYHGLVPVPVDIESDTLEMKTDFLEESITERSCMILVAFLYGTWYDLSKIHEVAQKYQLPIFEDLAEGFSGFSYLGQQKAEMTVISFGPIKTSTAFGGAISIIRNEHVFDQMQRILNSYPIQSPKVFMKKLAQYSLGMISLNSTVMNKILRPTFNFLRMDYKKDVVGLMRGFSKEDGLEKYRYQISAQMASFLLYRLTNFNEQRFLNDNKNIDQGTQILVSSGVEVPGSAIKRRVYWLYPVIAPDTKRSYDELNKFGIDAYKGVTQLNLVEPPIGTSFKFPENAARMINDMVYLPIHRNVPASEIVSMAKDASNIILSPKL